MEKEQVVEVYDLEDSFLDKIKIFFRNLFDKPF